MTSVTAMGAIAAAGGGASSVIQNSGCASDPAADAVALVVIGLWLVGGFLWGLYRQYIKNGFSFQFDSFFWLDVADGSFIFLLVCMALVSVFATFLSIYLFFN